jgi:hypothetical protein
MAVTQTVSIVNNNGDTFETAEDLMEQMRVECSDVANAYSAFIEGEILAGRMTNNIELNSAKTGVTITRVWNDDSWNDFREIGDTEEIDGDTFASSGWSMLSTDDQ